MRLPNAVVVPLVVVVALAVGVFVNGLREPQSKPTGPVGVTRALITATPQLCSRPVDVVIITFSRAKYPTIYQHYVDAIDKGWPKVLVLDRADASANRTRLLRNVPTQPGTDRDEYPPAFGREGWLGDVEPVPSAENRSQGSSMGGQLRGYCDGTLFEYAWSP